MSGQSAARELEVLHGALLHELFSLAKVVGSEERAVAAVKDVLGEDAKELLHDFKVPKVAPELSELLNMDLDVLMDDLVGWEISREMLAFARNSVP